LNLDLGSLFFRLGIDQSGFRTGLDKAEQDLGSSGSRMGSIAKGIAASLGVALTVGGAIGFGKAAVREFQEAERASADLRQILNQLGGGAAYTRGELERMAESMAGLSRFEDDAVLGVEAIILRYREIGRDIFPRVLSLSADLAEAMGGGEGSLASAATILGRALENPTVAVRSLRVANVILNDSQKELIKKMMEANDIAGAQKIILDELEGAIGGRARDLGDLTKATSELSKSWKELLESMGKTFAPDVQRSSGFWATQFKGLREYIELSRFAAKEFSQAGMGAFGYLPIMTQMGYIDDATRARYAASKEKELSIETQLGKEQANRAAWYKYFTEQTEKRLGLDKSSLEYSKTKLLMEQKLTNELDLQERITIGKIRGGGNRYDIGKGWKESLGANKFEDVPTMVIASAEAMKKLEIEAYKAADIAAYFGGAFVDAAFAGKNALNVLLSALRSFVSQAIQEWIRLKVLGMSDWFKATVGHTSSYRDPWYGPVPSLNSSRSTFNLSIIDKREASAPPISVERSTGANGGEMISVLIDSAVKSGFDSGKYDSSMRRNYRLSRVGKAA
jgi:hypothetical protein